MFIESAYDKAKEYKPPNESIRQEKSPRTLIN